MDVESERMGGLRTLQPLGSGVGLLRTGDGQGGLHIFILLSVELALPLL